MKNSSPVLSKYQQNIRQDSDFYDFINSMMDQIFGLKIFLLIRMITLFINIANKLIISHDDKRLIFPPIYLTRFFFHLVHSLAGYIFYPLDSLSSVSQYST